MKGMNMRIIELCEMAEDALFDAQYSGEMGYLEEALSLYKEALAYNAPLAAPYLGLACIAYGRGDHKEAQGLLVLAERLEPTHPDVLELKQRLKPPLSNGDSSTEPSLDTLGIHRLTLSTTADNTEAIGFTDDALLSVETALELTQDLGPPLEKNAVSEGAEVFLLQSILNQLGYSVSSSGKFDASTRSALMQYQHHQGLSLRRIVDQELRDALMKSLIEG